MKQNKIRLFENKTHNTTDLFIILSNGITYKRWYSQNEIKDLLKSYSVLEYANQTKLKQLGFIKV